MACQVFRIISQLPAARVSTNHLTCAYIQGCCKTWICGYSPVPCVVTALSADDFELLSLRLLCACVCVCVCVSLGSLARRGWDLRRGESSANQEPRSQMTCIYHLSIHMQRCTCIQIHAPVYTCLHVHVYSVHAVYMIYIYIYTHISNYIYIYI